MHGALHFDGSPHAGQGMLWIASRCSPESHHTITDEFVECAVMLQNGVGNAAKIKVDGIQGVTCLFVETSLRLWPAELILAHEFGYPLLARIGELCEPADIGEKNGDLAPSAQRKRLGLKQLIDDFWRNNRSKDGFYTPPLRLFKDHTPGYQANVRHD